MTGPKPYTYSRDDWDRIVEAIDDAAAAGDADQDWADMAIADIQIQIDEPDAVQPGGALTLHLGRDTQPYVDDAIRRLGLRP